MTPGLKRAVRRNERVYPGTGAGIRAVKKMQSWRALREGDVVDVVAPGSNCPPQALEAGLARLRSWGLQPRVPRTLFDPDPFFAAPAAVRWQHLRRALLARDSAAIWCARGGTGSLHLLSKLLRLQPGVVPKPLIGFSDITVFLVALNQAWGWRTVHGPVLSQLVEGRLPSSDLTRLKMLLFAEQPHIELSGLRAMNPRASRVDGLRGRLLGGNLATLQTLCGTAAHPDGRGAIVFVEDVNERGYEIDRMLCALEASGCLRGLKALVFGEFMNDAERTGARYARLAMRNLAERARFPVFSGLPVGHGRRLAPLVLGERATIERTGSGQRWRLGYSLAR